jgi:hypothetical protein
MRSKLASTSIAGVVIGAALVTAPVPSHALEICAGGGIGIDCPETLYVTLNTGGTLSNSNQPTSIFSNLSLGASPPATSPYYAITGSLPTDVQTLQEAASYLGYSGFDWISQIIYDPNPDYTALNPTVPLTFPFYDPPLGGYVGEATQDSYPFYWLYPIESSDCYPVNPLDTSSPCVPIETSNSLTFVDTPADGRLATSGGFIIFSTELVGVVPCTDPETQTCSLSGFAPGADLFNFSWIDNFDGTIGGATGPFLSNTLLADPDSGTGGVTITGEDVPEPSGAAIFIPLFLCCILITNRRRRQSLMIFLNS